MDIHTEYIASKQSKLGRDLAALEDAKRRNHHGDAYNALRAVNETVDAIIVETSKLQQHLDNSARRDVEQAFYAHTTGR